MVFFGCLLERDEVSIAYYLIHHEATVDPRVDEEAQIEIFIDVVPLSKKVRLEVQRNSTVAQVKHRIEEMEEIP